MFFFLFFQITNVDIKEMALAGFEPGTYCTEDEHRSTKQKASSSPVTHHTLVVEVVVARNDIAALIKTFFFFFCLYVSPYSFMLI